MKNKIKRVLTGIGPILHLLLPYYRYLRSNKGERLSDITFNNKHSNCLVLGNGPSLKADMISISNFFNDYDICAVNHFADSENFKKYKPNKYMLLDPYFWTEDAHPELVIKRERLFEQINQVDWDMQLYIPSFANDSLIRNAIKNVCVQIIVYKVAPIDRVDLDFASKLLTKKIFGPPCCNVLIYAVYLCIIAEYKEINIFGADLSFHNDVTVDQYSNELLIKYTHFYGSTKYEKLKKNPYREESFSMYELMQLTASTFYAHELLSKFATIKDIKIYNKSSFSLIDSYPRS